MSKKTILLASSAVLLAYGAYAQSGEQQFYQDILISDEVKQVEAEAAAKESAAKLLNEKQTIDNSGAETLKLRSDNIKKALETYGEAPFGLTWGLSKEEVEQTGVVLAPTALKDYENSFDASNLHTNSKEFSTVTLVFGDDNRLWRILARSKFITGDMPSGEKMLRQYHRFYNLLQQKYGNAQQTYSSLDGAALYDPDKNPNLLHDLELGDVDLYATFGGEDIGVALSVNVDGDMQSYLLIDYKNLKILKENEVKLLETL